MLKKYQSANTFNYKLQTFQKSYRKVRYWVSILYFLLVVQIWISTTLPEKQIFSVEQKISSMIELLNYLNNNFNMEGTDADKLVSNLLFSRFKYTVPWNIKNKDDFNSKYFLEVKTTLDSLKSFGLIDSIQQNNFQSRLSKNIPQLIEKHLQLYIEENNLFIEKNGHIQSELNRILEARVKRLQKEINEVNKDLFLNHISIPVTENIREKIEFLDESEPLSYNEIKEKSQIVKNYFKKNILKTPYLDLPLSNKPALILILIFSGVLYWYVYVLREYFKKIRISIEKENILKIASVTNTKNILTILEKNISSQLAQSGSMLFFDLIPILIFIYYTWNLIGVGILSISCCFLLIAVRYLLYRWIN